VTETYFIPCHQGLCSAISVCGGTLRLSYLRQCSLQLIVMFLDVLFWCTHRLHSLGCVDLSVDILALWFQGIAVFQLITFTPLTYNRTYVYPDWAQALGFLMAISIMISIPLVFVWHLAKAPGSLCQVNISRLRLNPADTGILVLISMLSGGHHHHDLHPTRQAPGFMYQVNISLLFASSRHRDTCFR
jgi:hypothetical protein